jgi:hypothetical protein
VADLLADRPVLGAVIGERGQQGNLLCQVRTLHGTIPFSRSGRKADVQEATITVGHLVPEEEGVDPLVLTTTVPVQTLAQARAIAGISAQRWSIETAFQTMHAWGQDAFMVRSWRAIERLLWVVAIAYTLATLLLLAPACRSLRRQARVLLRQCAVLGHHLTVGKLAQALSVDYDQHRRAWRSLSLP